MTATQTIKKISVLFAAIVAASLLAMAGPLASPGNTQQADPPPPTLMGETLEATTLTGVYGPDQGPGEFTVTSVTCSEDERTLTYTAHGPAEGPYPGTYEETGTFKLGDPAVFGPRTLESFEVNFKIAALIGNEPYTVTGTKRSIAPSYDAASNICFTPEYGSEEEEIFAAIADTPTTSYEATIETPSGSRFRDRGNTRVGFTSQRYYTSSGTLDSVYGVFGDYFYSELSETEPILPPAPEDTTAPEITGMPSSMIREATGPSGALVSWQAPTANDVVDGAVDVNCSPASGTIFPLGTTQVECSASDSRGNTATKSFQVSVLYGFEGFFKPVDNPDVATNSVRAGSAVPVKFSLGGDMGLDIFETGYPKSQQIPNPEVTVDGIEQTVTAGSSGLSYDPMTGQYTYVWKTDRAWAGQYRQLVVKLADGESYRANFKFTR